jgi:hypothetical protein
VTRRSQPTAEERADDRKRSSLAEVLEGLRFVRGILLFLILIARWTNFLDKPLMLVVLPVRQDRLWQSNQPRPGTGAFDAGALSDNAVRATGILGGGVEDVAPPV